ncbi:MAG: hypothetical protein U9Q75_04950, partial [Pseudomonadota bacterium]|nr:hypothetical protein [Pseudomonadota bacterium]
DKALSPIFDSIRIFQRRHPALGCRISLPLIRPTGFSCTELLRCYLAHMELFASLTLRAALWAFKAQAL